MSLMQNAVLAIALSAPMMVAASDNPASTSHAVAQAGASRSDTTAAIPKIDLKRLDSIHLGAGSQDSPTRSIRRFDIDDRGRFGFLASDGCDCDDEAFVLLDGDGRMLRRIALKDLPGMSTEFMHFHTLTWIAGDRWLLTDSNDGSVPGPITAALWVDAAKGTAARIAGFDSAPIMRVAGSHEGGFVALSMQELPVAFRPFVPEAITAFDASGRKRWTIADAQAKTPGTPLLFNDVVVTPSKTVVVLEDSARKLAEYSLDGKLLRTVTLAKLPGGAIAATARLQVDAAGGVLVQGVGMSPVRFALDGSLDGTLTPVYPGGRQFHPFEVRTSPDGRLWASNQEALLQLDKTGLVDRFVGMPFVDPDHLGAISGGIAVSSNGSIYAIDPMTLSVHVFDSNGKHVRVDRPDPKDVNSTMFWLSASDDGEVFQGRGAPRDANHDFLHYTPTGSRTGFESVALKDDTAEGMFAQPGSSNRWVTGHHGVALVDARGKLLRTGNATAQGQPFAAVLQAASAAPDGSFAVATGIDQPVSGAVKPRHVVLATVYSKSGEPVASWPFPDGMTGRYGSLAYDGSRLAFLKSVAESGDAQATTVFVTDARGKPQFRFDPAAVADGRPRSDPLMVFLVRHGAAHELWLSDVNGSIDRYAMP